jgi:hypothetical protein
VRNAGIRWASVFAALLLACGDLGTGLEDDNGELTLTLIETVTALPANVYVTFKVDTRDGDPVPGLGLRNFSVSDNGIVDSEFESNKTILSKPGRFMTSVALVLDLSGSITQTSALTSLKSASSSFAQSVATLEGVEMSVWWSNGEAQLKELVDFTSDPAVVVAAIDGINAELSSDPSTNLNGAIVQAMNRMEGRLNEVTLQDVTHVGAVVLFTDGTDRANRVSEEAALAAVRDASERAISVYSIGLQGEINEDFLRNVGVDGSRFAGALDGLVAEFSGLAERIEDEAASYYILAYCSPVRSGADNRLAIRGEVDGRSGVLETRYSAEGFTGGCAL